MVYLQHNTANQTAYFTLDEGRSFYSTAFTHYLMIMIVDGVGVEQTGTKLAQVLTVVNENTRATEVTLTTVGLTNTGKYQYFVYGQNSASNLDPNNASVVGLVERGTLVIEGDAASFDPLNDQQQITILS